MTRSTPARLYQLRSKMTISPAGRQMPHVALDVHLRFLALGRRGQRDDAKHARTDALGDRLDHPALAGAVAALEHDATLESLVHRPELQLDQFGVQPGEFALIGLGGQASRSTPRAPAFDRLFGFARPFVAAILLRAFVLYIIGALA